MQRRFSRGQSRTSAPRILLSLGRLSTNAPAAVIYELPFLVGQWQFIRRDRKPQQSPAFGAARKDLAAHIVAALVAEPHKRFARRVEDFLFHPLFDDGAQGDHCHHDDKYRNQRHSG